LAEKSLNEGNSVVNIGISSNDEYKLRWKKRKEEFLSLINKNMSKEDFNSQ
jgi:ABC-type xylose transport system substrate-binding protein